MGHVTDPLIALIHGVPAAIDPAVLAVRDEIPGARIWNILDDRLIEEVKVQGGVTPQLFARMLRLVDHALLEGADGVLITCSLYSFVAAAAVGADRSMPILGADSAAFHDVIEARPGRVVVVASVQAALEDSVGRLLEVAEEHHAHFEVIPILVTDAFEPAQTGDMAYVARVIIVALRGVLREDDAVLFAQYSLSPASAEVMSRLGVHVYTGPSRAARELRAALGNPHGRRQQFYAD